jgi:hypothetical protein
MSVNPGIIIGGIFLAAAAMGTAYLAYGAPSRDARQSDYPSIYDTKYGYDNDRYRYGGKSKRKTKRQK